MSTGFDYNRMSMLLAVLEKRAGFFFSTCDAYINVVGGLRLDEPATDLSVALALGFRSAGMAAPRLLATSIYLPYIAPPLSNYLIKPVTVLTIVSQIEGVS